MKKTLCKKCFFKYVSQQACQPYTIIIFEDCLTLSHYQAETREKPVFITKTLESCYIPDVKNNLSTVQFPSLSRNIGLYPNEVMAQSITVPVSQQRAEAGGEEEE